MTAQCYILFLRNSVVAKHCDFPLIEGHAAFVNIPANGPQQGICCHCHVVPLHVSKRFFWKSIEAATVGGGFFPTMHNRTSLLNYLERVGLYEYPMTWNPWFFYCSVGDGPFFFFENVLCLTTFSHSSTYLRQSLCKTLGTFPRLHTVAMAWYVASGTRFCMGTLSAKHSSGAIQVQGHGPFLWFLDSEDLSKGMPTMSGEAWTRSETSNVGW